MLCMMTASFLATAIAARFNPSFSRSASPQVRSALLAVTRVKIVVAAS